MAPWKIARTGHASTRLIVVSLVFFAAVILLLKVSSRPRTPATAISPTTPAPITRSPSSSGRIAPPTAPRPAAQARPAPAQPAPEPPSNPISPTDPLPTATVPAGDNVEERASDLARQVLAGGGRSFPALVAAIQLAGFTIRNPDGSVAQPTGPSQGIAFERYEVNALAELARNRRTVSAPLASFADGLASALPQLKDTSMADLLVDGIRQHADSAEDPLLFWAMFIVELGRQAKAHPAYDLLSRVDSAGADLDALQMVFIAKRLSGDLFAAAHADSSGTKSVGVGRPLKVSFASYTEPSYTPPSACTFKDAAGDIVDLAADASTTAFGKLLEFLESKGVKGAKGFGDFGNYANLALAYVQLIISHLAFEMEFEMQSAPPLVRTKEMRPQAGETKTIVATVKMNPGKLEWLNCLRMPLNAMGLDLSVDASGPVSGARVAWTASSGFSDVARYSGGAEQLVRYVADPGSRIQDGGAVGPRHSIMDQLTDSTGKARVQVEGVGQRENLGREPRPVMKHATAGASVVLKPASLFRDLKEATLSGLGGPSGLLTLPAELLYRTRWSYGGWYDFPVQDWKAGNGWVGWLSYTRIERRATSQKSEGKCCGGKPTRSEGSMETSETLNYRWEIPNDPDATMLTPGFSMATAAYTMNGKYDKTLWSFGTGWSSCRGKRPPAWRSHSEIQEGTADYEGEAQVTVRLDADSSFLISGGGPNGQPEGEMVTTQKEDHDDGCNGQDPTRTRTLNGKWRPGQWSGNMQGKSDPNADMLSGTETRTEKHAGAKTTITHIYNWELYR